MEYDNKLQPEAGDFAKLTSVIAERKARHDAANVFLEPLETVLKRYGVTIGDSTQVVRDEAYDVGTILSAEDFAVYEAYLEAGYVEDKLVKKHLALLDPNDGDLTWLVNLLSDRKADRVRVDIEYLAGLLSARKGVDASTGDERGLHEALNGVADDCRDCPIAAPRPE